MEGHLANAKGEMPAHWFIAHALSHMLYHPAFIINGDTRAAIRSFSESTHLLTVIFRQLNQEDIHMIPYEVGKGVPCG